MVSHNKDKDHQDWQHGSDCQKPFMLIKSTNTMKKCLS